MSGKNTHAETILVVEDEPVVLDLIQNILKEHGYPVIAARNGAEALLAAQDHDIDLILTDIVMPGMSGGALVQQLLLLKPGLRVLYMSGYTKYTVLNHGVLESVSSFIWKPFAPAELLEKIRSVLDSPPESA